MLNISELHHIDVQTGAVALAGEIRSAVHAALADGVQNVFFASAGGVAFLSLPAVKLLQERSTFPVYAPRAAELIENGNVNLGPESLVVFTSVSGTTKEAIAALEYARAKGARTLTLVGTAETPLATLADVSFFNETADDTSSENFLLQTLFVALAIIDYRGESPDWDTTLAEIQLLPNALVEVKRSFEDRAAALAEEIKDEQNHIITSAGNTWFEAWYYGMCILEEMQWVWTRPVHASDFFHGTLELVEDNVSVLLLKGEDGGRALEDRVEAFVPRFSSKLRVIDSRDFELPGVSAETRALVAPVVLAAALERLSAHLEVVRDHPLTTRRYYKRVSY
ncbi:SIS domain-containing protein [Microbacterium jejuense]|uniref:SIS domain-containing protein n=1 Tax=Microbacterium jejuense TaxID=1263637 RepID=A0ABS7HKW0_9MICO|nr:SIS domain-containing protein [Microbacterium jejuense]MBW9093070.1 SIS domain-containing protein [Microbacterium jejuense]